MVQQAQSPSVEKCNAKLFDISNDVKSNSPASIVSKGPKIIKVSFIEIFFFTITIYMVSENDFCCLPKIVLDAKHVSSPP